MIDPFESITREIAEKGFMTKTANENGSFIWYVSRQNEKYSFELSPPDMSLLTSKLRVILHDIKSDREKTDTVLAGYNITYTNKNSTTIKGLPNE